MRASKAVPKEGDPTVIYVSKNQLTQVEYLIEQSIRGNHVLFDPERVRQIFEREASLSFQPLFSEEQAYSVEHHIERIVQLPTLGEKRAYLGSLEPETLDHVIRTYLNIVENNLYESKLVRH
jgi:hypothetical protein